MSIHKSKGLEFPVVVLADLEKRFNTTDLVSPLIIDEHYGLCPVLHLPRTAETYPSLPHWLSQRSQRRALLDEEARLLYVAMTRAQERLFFVGQTTGKQLDERWDPQAGPSPSQSKSQSFADWLVPWSREKQQSSGNEESQPPGVRCIFHDDITTEPIPPIEDRSKPQDPSPGPTETDNERIDTEDLNQRLTWEYPFIGASQQTAKVSISALSRGNENSIPLVQTQHRSDSPTMPPPKRTPGAGAEIGLAYHRALQFFNPAMGGRLTTARNELSRLEEIGALSSDDIQLISAERIVSFWSSEVGQHIRTQADRLHRELPFTAQFQVKELQALGFAVDSHAAETGEWVILQGVVDVAVLGPKEVWILDFKSEQVAAEDCQSRAVNHASQLAVYRAALERIYQRPVTKTWIHFLVPGCTVDALPDRSPDN